MVVSRRSSQSGTASGGDGSGSGSLSSTMLSMCKDRASIAISAACCGVSPWLTQPGRSGKTTPTPESLPTAASRIRSAG